MAGIMSPQELRQLFLQTAENKGLPYTRFNEDFWRKSLEYYKKGDYDGAIGATAKTVVIVEPPTIDSSTFSASQQLISQSPIAQSLNTQELQGEAPQTEEDEEENVEALNMDSFYNVSKLHFNLGMLNRARGDYRRALKYFTIAIERDRYMAISFFMRGVCYQEMGFDWPPEGCPAYMLEKSSEGPDGRLIGEARTLIECAVLDYTKVIELLRAKTKIDYHQIGLPFQMRKDEPLYNRAQCFRKLSMFHRARDDILLAINTNNSFQFPFGGVEEAFQKKKRAAYEQFLVGVNEELVYASVATLIHPWKPPPSSTSIPESSPSPSVPNAGTQNQNNTSKPGIAGFSSIKTQSNNEDQGKGKEKVEVPKLDIGRGKEQEQPKPDVPASVLALRKMQSQRALESEKNKSKEKEKEKEQEKEKEKEKDKGAKQKKGSKWDQLKTSLKGKREGAGGTVPANSEEAERKYLEDLKTRPKGDSFIYKDWGLHEAGDDKVEDFLLRVINRPSYKELRESGILPQGLVEKELEEQQKKVLEEQKSMPQPPTRRPPPLPPKESRSAPVRPPRPDKPLSPAVDVRKLN